jgi:hypothetical protein
MPKFNKLNHSFLREQAPYWAKWIAQDADGSWWAYEVEPLQYHIGWYENELGRNQKIIQLDKPYDWRKTLTKL